MPSPIAPQKFCEAVPANNADFCTRFTKFLNIPQLLCDLFSWMLTSSGAISTEFKQEVATYSAPTGTVIFTLTTNVGDGWLLMDGRAVSRTEFAALFAEIGTRYGVGDGSTTFNIPDGRGRSLIGAGAGSGLTFRDINAKYVGEETHLQTAAEVGPHTHDVIGFNDGSTTTGDGGWYLGEGSTPATDLTGPKLRTGTTELSADAQGFNVIHPCLIGYNWIKT